MNVVNIADESLGTRIIGKSSEVNPILSAASNVLNSNNQQVWLTSQGLPQYIIISLENVQIHYSEIVSIGIYCWHDYDSNPKSLELWVKDHEEEEEFVHWSTLSIRKKKGQQLFPIQPIPNVYKIVKVIITETYGAFSSYLNQLIMFAQCPYQSTISKPIRANSFSLQETQRNQFNLETSPVQDEQSFQANAAMLTLSKNVMQMEQQIMKINRRIDEMDLKIDASHTNIHRTIDQKLNKVLEDDNNGKTPPSKNKSIKSDKMYKVVQLANQLNLKLKQRTNKIKQLASKKQKKKHKLYT